jgi:hypothetical protein
MTKRPKPLSKAQLQFMKEHVPTYLNWLNATGHAIGIKMQPWQKRVVEALIRKGLLTEEGHVTDTGKKAYERKLSGKTATFAIIDDPIEPRTP